MFAHFYHEMTQPVFWVALSKVIWIDVLLSGDNALVIALACRGLDQKQRLWGMVFGAGGAVFMRIAFTGVIASLMELPYLRIIGALALLYVATKLLVPDSDEADIKSTTKLWSAVRVVMLADMVMSLDNVIAVAAAANGSLLLLAIGLSCSIPLIVAGAAIITEILNRFPILVWGGAGLLGWIAGEVMSTDVALSRYLSAPFDAPYFYAAIGSCLVFLAGGIWRSATSSHQTA